MAHYALLDENNIVTEVITGKDEDDNATLPEGFTDWEAWYADLKGQTCKRTSYNTVNNTHSLGGTPFRGNYAGIGYSYDAENDVFLPPKPFDSWVKTDDNCGWKAPVDEPTTTLEEHQAGKRYVWNEDTTSWDVIQPS